jgi:hypothetical protein
MCGLKTDESVPRHLCLYGVMISTEQQFAVSQSLLDKTIHKYEDETAFNFANDFVTIQTFLTVPKSDFYLTDGGTR